MTMIKEGDRVSCLTRYSEEYLPGVVTNVRLGGCQVKLDNPVDNDNPTRNIFVCYYDIKLDEGGDD